MEQSPSWEANSLSHSQEILHLLGNLDVHYPVHNNLPLFPSQIQINLVHTLQTYYFRINFNIILSSMPRP
jgi:hypothetical protein